MLIALALPRVLSTTSTDALMPARLISVSASMATDTSNMIERRTTGRGITNPIISLLPGLHPTDNVDILLPGISCPGNAAPFSFSSQYQRLEKVPMYLFGGMRTFSMRARARHCRMHMTHQGLVYSPFAAHGASRRAG